MKSHGLLMKPDLIRATLAEIKTEHRVIPTPRNTFFDGWTWPKELTKSAVYKPAAYKTALDWANATIDPGPSPAGNAGPYLHVRWPENETTHRIYPHIQPGDEIYVKEAFCHDPEDGYYYKADGEDIRMEDGDGYQQWTKQGVPASPWRSPLFMPRDAARIVRPVLEVGYEWLHDITEVGAISEGFEAHGCIGSRKRGAQYSSAKDGFLAKWLEIHGNTDNRIVLVYKFGKENVA